MDSSDRHPLLTPGVPALSRTVSMELSDDQGSGGRLTAEMLYDVGDPYAVTMVFATPAGPVRWVLSRELLSAGWLEPSGDGDVHVWPDLSSGGAAVVMLELCSPTGGVVLELDTGTLLGFLGETRALVEPGTENDHLDLEAAIEALLLTGRADVADSEDAA